MHEIDLKNIKLRTDLVSEVINEYSDLSGVIKANTNYDDIKLEEVVIDSLTSKRLNKVEGIYKTISFKDVTDKDNYKNIKIVFCQALQNLIAEMKIKDNAKCLVIGLGNSKSTPDALGPKVVDNVLVTKYLFDLGEVEDGYRNVSSFKPSVTGVTGIETKDLIKGIVNVSKPDFLIIIDSLCAKAIDRVNKTIQLTNSGVEPGSGIGNFREAINKDTYNIPVIVIGVPTITDAITIVSDTFQYMLKQFSYKIDNLDNSKLKLVSVLDQNYLEESSELTPEDKEVLLGLIGTLDEVEFKKLLFEVLSPIDYNLMVTPKEIDFVIDKLSKLIGESINKVLHKSYNLTN